MANVGELDAMFGQDFSEENSSKDKADDIVEELHAMPKQHPSRRRVSQFHAATIHVS
jgi:hypothetical protein